jgi:hypothetical protein
MAEEPQEPTEPREPKESHKHEKATPETDNQVPPDQTPSPREPHPGKRGR